MSKHCYARESKPRPRLIHIQPGQTFVLASRCEGGPRFPADNGKEHLMLSRCKKYAYYKDSKGRDAKVALYHEVFPEGMVFGDGGGWRMK